MATNKEFVQELAKRYNVNYEDADAQKLDEYGRGAIKYRDLQNDPNADWNQAGISTPDQYEGFKTSLEAQYKQRGSSNGGGGTSSGTDSGTQPPPTTAAPPAQAWNDPGVSQAINAQTDLIRQQMSMLSERQKAADAQAAAQAQQRDQLYGQLKSRADQSTQIDANDPIIKGQVDVFRNEQDRAQRNYLSDAAESSGPYENLRGQQRMAAEHTGQAVGGFQAELLGRELSSRRAEIADALGSMRGMLTADQQANLQTELSTLDKQMQAVGLSGQNAGLTSQSALGFGNLGLGYAGLDVQKQLGMGDLALRGRGQDLTYDQFLRELAQRQWEAGDNSRFRWANL